MAVSPLCAWKACAVQGALVLQVSHKQQSALCSSGLLVQLRVWGGVVVFRKNCHFHGLGESWNMGKGWGREPVTAQGHSAELPKAFPSLWIWDGLSRVCTAPECCPGVTSILPLLGCAQNQMDLGCPVGWFSSFLCISKQSLQIPVLQLTEKN